MLFSRLNWRAIKCFRNFQGTLSRKAENILITELVRKSLGLFQIYNNTVIYDRPSNRCHGDMCTLFSWLNAVGVNFKVDSRIRR